MRLPFDEINDLVKEKFPLDFFDREFSKEEVEDEIEDLLVMSYALGWGLVDDDMGTDTPIDQKAVLRALESKINGKTYKEYLEPHLEQKDINGIYLVLDGEVHRMYNVGQYDNASANGVQYKTWLTMEDDKVRIMHQDLEKVKVKLDEYFYTQDDDMGLYPGGFAKAENNCNCRCILSYSKQ